MTLRAAKLDEVATAPASRAIMRSSSGPSKVITPRPKNHVKVCGWEEWELGGDLKVTSSLGWFDAAKYARQIAEGL